MYVSELIQTSNSDDGGSGSKTCARDRYYDKKLFNNQLIKVNLHKA